MEDTHVKSLKPVFALATALLMAGCSAGQITQTSDQVAAVDGANVETENGELAVQDVTVVLDETGSTALKFSALNQDTSMTSHSLRSVSVDGTPVSIESSKEIGYNCVLVGDSAAGLDRMPQDDGKNCIEYIRTALPNDSFAYGGTVPVTFTFDTGTLEVNAPVSAPLLPSGQVHRDLNK
ncbi:hypothetical protein [Corynebacterium sp. MC3]|uniref:hypothetical protein n=1 Tax=Corynebacterium sp. MC3 TaxID=1720193 RepID=UPI0008DB084F|nr:hypothetical protein [Corynebacterium sp. MC3]